MSVVLNELTYCEGNGGDRPRCSWTRRPQRRGPGWAHELKHDGYRLQVRDGRVRLYTMNGADWTKPYPLIAAEAAEDARYVWRSLRRRDGLRCGKGRVLLSPNRKSVDQVILMKVVLLVVGLLRDRLLLGRRLSPRRARRGLDLRRVGRRLGLNSL